MSRVNYFLLSASLCVGIAIFREINSWAAWFCHLSQSQNKVALRNSYLVWEHNSAPEWCRNWWTLPLSLSRTLALFPRVHVRDLCFLHPPLFVLELWHRMSWGWAESGENADEIQLEYFMLMFRMLSLSHVIWHRAGKIRRMKLIAKTTIYKNISRDNGCWAHQCHLYYKSPSKTHFYRQTDSWCIIVFF